MASPAHALPGFGTRLRDRIPRALQFELLGLLILLGLVWSWPRTGRFLDFGSFVATGRAAAEGLNPYGVYPLTFKVYFERIGVVATPNLNPPISVPVFEALARLEPAAALRGWYFCSLLFYLASLALLTRAYPEQARPLRVGWALCLAGLWHTQELGQIYTPLLLATCGAWVLLKSGRKVPAGLLIGVVVAVKPNFLVWPVLLLVAGEAATALAALASTALLSLVPVALYGPGIYSQWLAAAGSFTGYHLPGNSSLPGLAARAGLPWLGTPLAALLLLGVAALVWRRRPTAMQTSGLGLVASLLASPISWLGYTILLLPVLFGRRWSPLLRGAAVILAVPFVVVLLWFQASAWLFVVLGWAYGWGLLLALAGLIRELLTPPCPEAGTACRTHAGSDQNDGATSRQKEIENLA